MTAWMPPPWIFLLLPALPRGGDGVTCPRTRSRFFGTGCMSTATMLILQNKKRHYCLDRRTFPHYRYLRTYWWTSKAVLFGAVDWLVLDFEKCCLSSGPCCRLAELTALFRALVQYFPSLIKAEGIYSPHVEFEILLTMSLTSCTPFACTNAILSEYHVVLF